MRRPALFLAAVILCPCAAISFAQRHSTAMSEAEEDAVRDAAPLPAARVAVYQNIIETRIKRIQAVLTDKRAQGRREDLRQNMDEITGLIDEFEDNLEEYGSAHRDLRKPLPKLIDATLRWESVLKQAPDDDSYNLTRKLALEAVADVKAEATEMLPVQVAYFKEHPPNKEANPGGIGNLPRE